MRCVVVGAGVLGLAHAWFLRRLGHEVQVLDRSPSARGASVRNFGMIWPIGQPPGPIRELALRSREHWLEVATHARLECRPCGSLHLAYADDEWRVLEEFVGATSGAATLLDAEEALRRRPGVRREGLIGAMASDTELCVDPRTAVAGFADHLRTLGVTFRFGTSAWEFAGGRVTTNEGALEADQVFVCTGPDLYERMPEVAAAAGLRRCRLQMLRMRPKRAEALGPHLAAGWTLLHYANFAGCPSLPALRDRLTREWPRQAEHGVHVLVSQHADGTLTVGDSHHDDLTAPPYRSEEVDRAIVDYLDTFLPVENYEILQRWEGVYNRTDRMPYLTVTPELGLHVANVFGTGMTLSFGVAERHVQEVLA